MNAAPTLDSESAQKAPPLVARACRMRGRRVYLEITDRREISFPVTKYATLTYASQVELETIHLCDDGRAVAWANLDEVIQVDDVAHNLFVHTARQIAAGPH
jgi:Protein of unknown function (DUF2442)